MKHIISLIVNIIIAIIVGGIVAEYTTDDLGVVVGILLYFIFCVGDTIIYKIEKND